MEAGYDYLLLRGSKRRKPNALPGIFFVLIGSMLIAIGGAYFAYTTTARANLSDLEATLPGVASVAPLFVDRGPATVQRHSVETTVKQEQTAAQPVTQETPAQTAGESNPKTTGLPVVEAAAPVEPEGEAPAKAADGGNVSEAPAAAAGAPSGRSSGVSTFDEPEALAVFVPAAEGTAANKSVLPDSLIGSQRLFPGESLLPKFWNDPLSYESASQQLQSLLEGFNPLAPDQGFPLESRAASTRLIVPSVEIDARVVELAIEDLAGSRAYQTPDRAAGHIPETANAGEAGSAWFFGHTETPLLGEGSIFFNLARIPDMLKEGRDVFAVAESSEGQYLYRMTSSQVVHQDDMRLYDTGGATIHLVSCVPRLAYDHRLIVSGELIGHK